MDEILSAANQLLDEGLFPLLSCHVDEDGSPQLASAVWGLACAVKQHADALRLAAIVNNSSVSVSCNSEK